MLEAVAQGQKESECLTTADYPFLAELHNTSLTANLLLDTASEGGSPIILLRSSGAQQLGLPYSYVGTAVLAEDS